VFLIGPWLDTYVAEQIVRHTPGELEARVLVRPEHQVDAETWGEIVAGLETFAGHWKGFEARTLERLHAKCLIIDDRLAYVGSANWYRYSLEASFEIVLRGSMEAVPDLHNECEKLWEQATRLSIRSRPSVPTAPRATGITHEVLDPLAAQVLKDNPKAFVLGKKKRRAMRG
jgi:phosphatidylserine/phosphatidylglycerophosphate/cardiolipin synthase-like enzyme